MSGKLHGRKRTVERLLGGFLVCGLFLWANRGGQTCTAPVGLYAQAQILQKCGSVCQLFASHTSDFEISICPLPSFEKTGKPHPVWIVDAKDIAENNIVHLVYNACTGELERLWPGKPAAYQPDSLGPLKDAQAACRAAEYWVTSLGLSSDGPSWRFSAQSIPPGNAWVINGWSIHCFAHIEMDSRGRLLEIRIQRNAENAGPIRRGEQ